MSKLVKKNALFKKGIQNFIFFKKSIQNFIVILVMSKLVKKMNFFTRNKKKANSLCGKEPTMHHGVNGSNPA